MTLLVNRYFKPETLNLKFDIITPLFMGGSDQNATLSPAPFKSALRFWWRVSGIHKATNTEELYKREMTIFGDAEIFGKSNVTLLVQSKIKPSRVKLQSGGEKIKHSELPNGKQHIESLSYMAGMGILDPHLKPKKSYFPPNNGDLHLKLIFKQDVKKDIKTALSLFEKFGGLGGRNRNAWGSLQMIESHFESDASKQINFKSLIQDGIDYPKSLGFDSEGLLAWEVIDTSKSWELAMHNLAKIYLKLRLSFSFIGGREHSKPQERHLLGYPTGKNHKVKKYRDYWGYGRSTSPLLFTIRKNEEGYKARILHLPYHNPGVNSDSSGISWEIDTWKKVHRRLDENNELKRFEMN